MGLKKFHAVLISSNDFWVYDPDSYDTKTKLYSDFTVVKGDSKKEDSDMKRCSYFFELNNEDNHGFKPIAIKYDDAEGFLIVEGEQQPMGKLKKRVFQIGESARRYKNMRGPRHSVDTIVVSRDSKKQEIKDYLKQQQDDSKSAETFQADTLNQINPIFVEGAEDVMGAEYIEFSKSDFDEIEDSLEKDIKNLKQTHRMMLDFKDAESNDRMSELENKAKKLYLDEIDEAHIKEVCDEYDLDYHDKKDYAKACSKYLDQIDYIHILDMLDSDDLKELKQLYKDNDISYYKQMGAESEIFCADCGGRRKYDAEGDSSPIPITLGDELLVEIPNKGMSRGSVGHSLRQVFKKLGYHISPIPKKHKGLTYIKTNSNPVTTFIYSKYKEVFEKSLKEIGINEVNFYEVERMPIIASNTKLVEAGFEAESSNAEISHADKSMRIWEMVQQNLNNPMAVEGFYATFFGEDKEYYDGMDLAVIEAVKDLSKNPQWTDEMFKEYGLDNCSWCGEEGKKTKYLPSSTLGGGSDYWCERCYEDAEGEKWDAESFSAEHSCGCGDEMALEAEDNFPIIDRMTNKEFKDFVSNNYPSDDEDARVLINLTYDDEFLLDDATVAKNHPFADDDDLVIDPETHVGFYDFEQLAEWDFGNDREALRNSDENSDFNNAWRRIFKSKRREWPSWGQKFYDKYKWTLDDSTWNPYAKGGDFEDEEEPKGFRDAEDDEIAYKIVEQLVDAGDNDLLIEVAKYLGIGYEYEDRYNDMDILFDEVEKTIKNAPKKYLYQLDKALMEDMNAEGVEAETFEAQSDDLFVLTFSDPMRYGKMVQLPFTSRNQAERYVDMHIRPYNKKRPHQNIVYSIKQDEQDVVDFVQEISPFPMGKLFASFIVVGVSAIAGAKLLNR